MAKKYNVFILQPWNDEIMTNPCVIRFQHQTNTYTCTHKVSMKVSLYLDMPKCINFLYTCGPLQWPLKWTQTLILVIQALGNQT